MFTVVFSFLATIPPELINPPSVVETAVARIKDAEEYTLRVSVPGGRDEVMRFRHEENRQGNTWGGWRVVPYVLPIAIPSDGAGKGEVTLTFEFPGRKEPMVLKSKGLAEDIYLLKHFVPEKDSAKWIEKVAPESKLVIPWPENVDEAGEFLEKVPAEFAAAVKLGQEAYDAKRPELTRRFNKSYLYYAPAETKDWRVIAGKDTLAIQTGCSDLMYAARFRVELKKTAKGEWEVVRILAQEYFKGE